MQPAQQIDLRRTRDFGAMVNLTFEFVRQNFRLLGKCLLFVLGPVLLLASAAGGYLIAQYYSMMADSFVTAEPYSDTVPELSTLGVALLLSAGTGLVATALLLGVVNAFVTLYLERGPEGFDVGDVRGLVKETFWSILGTTLGIGLLVVAVWLLPVLPGVLITSPVLAVIGLLVAIVPTIYVSVVGAITVPVRAQEDIPFIAAIGRSFELIRGRWWSTFGLLVVMGLTLSVASGIFMVPQYIAMAILGVTGTDSPGTIMVVLAATSIIGLVGTYSLYTVLFLTCTLQYFNLLEEKEGKGTMELIGEIGAGSPAGEARGSAL